MEQSRIFQWIARVNAIIFLIILVTAAVMLAMSMLQTSDWQPQDAVVVKDAEEEQKVMRLGDLVPVAGHDVQYVELRSISSGKRLYSSSYGSSHTKNVLFLVGPELAAHWLYDTEDYHINGVQQLTMQKKHADTEAPAVALLYQVIKEDSNGDGELSWQDQITVALTKPDGNGYVELGQFDALISHEADKKGEHLTLLVRKGGAIFVEQYGLIDFNKIAEKMLTRIGEKV